MKGTGGLFMGDEEDRQPGALPIGTVLVFGGEIPAVRLLVAKRTPAGVDLDGRNSTGRIARCCHVLKLAINSDVAERRLAPDQAHLYRCDGNGIHTGALLKELRRNQRTAHICLPLARWKPKLLPEPMRSPKRRA